MVNLLLLGTSFTKQPRIRTEDLTAASRSGLLRSRVDDLVAGVSNPAGNERLVFVQNLLRAHSATDNPGVFIYKTLQRVLEERKAIAEQRHSADSLLDRSSVFKDRGVSLDTSILPDFAIEQTLRDLKARGLLREGVVNRVAVIGPGLDFSDKNEESSYDYYPQQTVQPFAFYDSLLRLKLARPNALALTVLDISARVLDHLRHARKSAYVIQLPRDVSRPWPPALVDYWRALGDQVGTSVPPLQPPSLFKGLETRAVQVKPAVVLACEPVDVNIIVQRSNLRPEGRFDLVIGTNIFLYYDTFQQALALENIGSMLKPGGLLLTNDKLPESKGGAMAQAGTTLVRYNERDASAVEAVGWYRRR
jgi:SAM-dependent methyltransferase